MAEALALLGAAAAAAQFAEIGFKVVYKCSVLVKESREYPEFLQRTRNEMHHLLCLVKVATESTDSPPEVQPATDENQKLQSANDRRSAQLESIWKDCSRQAEVIDTALQSMTREIETRGIIGQWKKLRMHPRIHGVEKALGELERCKTTLGLFLGNESLYRMGRMHHDVSMTHDKFVHLEEFLSRMFEEYHKKTENTVFDAIQRVQEAKSVDSDTYDRQQRNTQQKAPNMLVPYSANQERNSNRANISLSGKKRSDTKNSDVFFAYFKRFEWSKMLTLAGNTVILQLGSKGTKLSTSTSEDKKNRFLNFYLRLRTAWLFDLAELNFSLQQYPGAPSVRISLKALTRVSKLPLESFFKDLYGYRMYRNKKLGITRRLIPSKERQVRLFILARKLLLQDFYAGKISPSYINEDGETLIHLQARLYKPGYETFFAKMTEFLISMGVGIETSNDELQTAQHVLCDTVLFYRKARHTISPGTFVNETQIPWTGPPKGKHMNALVILQCIQFWPESILDTGYGQICDIVLRKSVDDLRNLPFPYTAQRGQQISPLHFAAAASWPEGVETLVSIGHSRFQADFNGKTPLDMAIDVQCIPAVEILLTGDCLEFFTYTTREKVTALPKAFRKVANRGDSRLNDIIIKCLLRHKFLLPSLLPYHDLAREKSAKIKFAEQLFIAGFRDIEAYDSSGYTPLMIYCANGDIRMASFLMQRGADPRKCHEHGGFRAGHLLCYGVMEMAEPFSPVNIAREYGFRAKSYEKEIIKVALDTSVDIGSYCRCSLDGFSPIIAMFHGRQFADTFYRKQNFQYLISNIDSLTDRKKYWRAFVMGEVFDRLGMTHTCTTLYPKHRFFPDNRRIEIEDEEQELFFRLEEIVARFDLFSENFGDDLSRCVDEFFDDLDSDLRRNGPFEYWPWSPKIDINSLWPGLPSERYYFSCRGQRIKYDFKETIKEESMLRLLFP